MTQTKAELLQTKHQGDLKLGDADSSHYVGFKAPATVGSNLVWTLPATDGSANQFLQTNASGVLGWGTADVSSAMPLTGGTFTGDVTFDGATAGRDIVFDRSDNALEFADNAKATFGTGADLTIKHESNTTYATNITGGFYIQSNTLALRSVSQENYLVAAENGAVELFHNNTKTFETTATGIAVTGAATISTNLTVTGDLTVSGTTTTINTQTLDVEDKNVVIGKVSSPSDTTADGGGWTLKGATDKTFNWVNSTDAWTSSEHIHLIDDKKLLLGTGSDFSIYHDGSGSYLQGNSSGSGNVYLDANGSKGIYIRSGDGASGVHQAVTCINNAQVELYHDNSKKFETTSTGATVTGALATTQLNVTNGLSSTLNTTGYSIHFGDSTSTIAYRNRIRMGDSEDLQIFHDGTHSYITNSVGELVHRTQTWHTFANHDGGETVALLKVNGGCELFYDNSKKIETTSGGVNVTGALTVNGAALSSAPTITATASGAISANDAVIVNSNGTVSKPALTAPTVTSPATADGSSTTHYDICYNTTDNVVAAFYRQGNTSQCRIGTVAIGSVTWGSSIQITSASVENCQIVHCSKNNVYLLAYRDANGRGACLSMTSNGTSAGSISGVTQFNTGTSTSSVKMEYNTSAEAALVIYRNGNNGLIRVVRYNSGGAPSISSDSSISGSGNMRESGMGYDSDTEKMVIFWRNNSNGAGYCRVITHTNTSITDTGSDNMLHNDNPYYVTLTYDSVNSKMLATFTDGGGGEKPKCTTGTISGTSISFSSFTTIDSSIHYAYTSAVFNPALEKHQFFGKEGTGDDLWFAEIDTSGSTPTVSGLVEVSADNNNNFSAATYDPDTNQSIVIFQGNNDYARYIMRNSGTTTLTTENFIGFSSAGYSNGNTATINIVGNTTTQSSLTPGKKYYVQADATVGLSPHSLVNVEAGTSILSTKLIIKG